MKPSPSACPPAPDVSSAHAASPRWLEPKALLPLWEDGTTPQGLVSLDVCFLHLMNLKEEFCLHMHRVVSGILGTLEKPGGWGAQEGGGLLLSWASRGVTGLHGEMSFVSRLRVVARAGGLRREVCAGRGNTSGRRLRRGGAGSRFGTSFIPHRSFFRVFFFLIFIYFGCAGSLL